MFPLLCPALCDQRGVGGCHAGADSFCGFFAVILLLMTYSFASLHSACLENNEGVCCINLCNGEREEVGGGQRRRRGGEEKSDELMLLHCSSSIHTLHLVVFMPCAHS